MLDENYMADCIDNTNQSHIDLLDAVSDDRPAGNERLYVRELRETLLSLRKAELPAHEQDTSYRRSPDWLAIVSICENALKNETKDIRLLGHWVEAQTQAYGLEGLLSGLNLLNDFVAECWGYCNPSIDDGDIESRTAPLENMLNDRQRGFCFPQTVRNLKLLGSETLSFSFTEHQDLISHDIEESQKTIKAVLSTTTSEGVNQTATTISHCLEQLSELKNKLHDLVGNEAPTFTFLHEALVDCQHVVVKYQRSVDNEDAVKDLTGESDSNESLVLPVIGSHGPDSPVENSEIASPKIVETIVSSRSAAYQQITAAANYLQTIEPHSPIPHLLRRAVELGKLPFSELISEIVRDESILKSLRREFGIEPNEEDVESIS